ncbi:MAG: ABC transporter substrate-binding protein [Mesorhizobium amorphae]|nr:MAG: ABC transporter substrate-binding protein [Mesorhizobium amorphae]
MFLRLRSLALLASVITFASLPAHASEKLDVVATFSVLADFARVVGGDRVEVSTLIGPDGDAHAYEPKPADARAMASADVILVNGLHFEGFLDRLVETSGTKAPVAVLTKGITPIDITDDAHAHEGEHAHEEGEHAHEAAEASGGGHDHHDHGDQDPHAFQSLPNAKIYVRNVADAFCTADAAGCDTFRANASAYEAELDKLDAQVRADVAAIPEASRTIITSHDAFGYFAREYGLTFLAPEGLSTEAEPSAADVAKLISEVREDKAGAVFMENITNPRLLEQIASETGLKMGGTLYSDALSGPDGPAATYLDMVRHNIATIKSAINGS